MEQNGKARLSKPREGFLPARRFFSLLTSNRPHLLFCIVVEASTIVRKHKNADLVYHDLYSTMLLVRS